VDDEVVKKQSNSNKMIKSGHDRGIGPTILIEIIYRSDELFKIFNLIVYIALKVRKYDIPT